MDERWVVIRDVGTEHEAQIIKGLLESEKIPVWIKQEAYGKAMGMPGLLSGIRILVPAKYLKDAEEILRT